jgi:hypothetical protein
MENKVKVRKKVEEGASLYITESPKCGIQVNAEKPHFKEKDASGRECNASIPQHLSQAS